MDQFLLSIFLLTRFREISCVRDDSYFSDLYNFVNKTDHILLI